MNAPSEIFVSNSTVGYLKIQNEPDPASEGELKVMVNDMTRRASVIVQLPLVELTKMHAALGEYIKQQELLANPPPRELKENERGWFRLRITNWGSITFWGTRKEAGARAREKADWEGERAFVKRLHDDDEDVLKEIESMRKFFKARGVPYEGSKDPDALRERDAYFSNLPEAREAPKEP